MKKIQESQTDECLASNQIKTEELPFGYFLGKTTPKIEEDFQFISINTLFEQITQTASEDIIGQCYSSCLSAHAFNKDWNKTISLAMATQAPNQTDLYDHKLKKWIRLQVIPIDKSYFHAYLQDISKDISQKTEASKLKDKLFSMVIHDLRAPIISSYSLLELIHQNTSYDKQTKDDIINEVIKSSKQAYYLLENMLHWALSQSQRLLIKKEYININNVIARNINLFSNLIKQKELVVSHPMAEEVYAFADENMCDLIIRNILINAIKYSHPKGKIELYSYIQENKLIIDIKDEGIGIEKDRIPMIFVPNKYFSTNGTNNEKGYGLGLPLCSELLELNQGSIKVQSTIGKGSTFSILLPRKKNN